MEEEHARTDFVPENIREIVDYIRDNLNTIIKAYAMISPEKINDKLLYKVTVCYVDVYGKVICESAELNPSSEKYADTVHYIFNTLETLAKQLEREMLEKVVNLLYKWFNNIEILEEKVDYLDGVKILFKKDGKYNEAILKYYKMQKEHEGDLLKIGMELLIKPTEMDIQIVQYEKS